MQALQLSCSQQAEINGSFTKVKQIEQIKLSLKGLIALSEFMIKTAPKCYGFTAFFASSSQVSIGLKSLIISL